MEDTPYNSYIKGPEMRKSRVFTSLLTGMLSVICIVLVAGCDDDYLADWIGAVSGIEWSRHG